MNGMDLFAEALWQFHQTGDADLWIERDDGYLARENVRWYFTTWRDFPAHERGALEWARGRVLDIGCGAGRHALYLQRCGLRVTAVDVSPQIVQLARTRGVRDVRVVNACARLPFRTGEFDTVVLFGNNLGIAGTERKLAVLLRELHRVTSPRGRILATTRQPSTTHPIHRAYLQRNIARRRAPGQLCLRVVLEGRRGAWFDLLLLAPTDVMRVAAKAGWELAAVFPLGNFEEGYAVVLQKSGALEGRRTEDG